MQNIIGSVDSYSSGYGVLNDFSNEIYRDTMRLYKPIISGEHIVKRTAADLSIRPIDKIMKLSSQKQDRLLDVFTDLVSVSFEADWYEFIEKLDDKIRNHPEFRKDFDALDNYFDKLDKYQKTQVINLSINKLNGEIESIRKEINDRVWIKNANIEELMIVDQILYFMQNVLQRITLGKFIKKSEQKKLQHDLGFSLYLLLRLEAYRKKKIKLDNLKEDLSSSNRLPKEEYIKPSEYDLIKEVFGE
jgi:hypothetical protein